MMGTVGSGAPSVWPSGLFQCLSGAGGGWPGGTQPPPMGASGPPRPADSASPRPVSASREKAPPARPQPGLRARLRRVRSVWRSPPKPAGQRALTSVPPLPDNWGAMPGTGSMPGTRVRRAGGSGGGGHGAQKSPPSQGLTLQRGGAQGSGVRGPGYSGWVLISRIRQKP